MGNTQAKRKKAVLAARRKNAPKFGDVVEQSLLDDNVEATTENDEIETTSSDKNKEKEIDDSTEAKGEETLTSLLRDELIDLYGEKLLIEKKRAQFRKDMDLYEEILDPEGFKRRVILRKATFGNLTMKQKIMRIRKRLKKKKKKIELQNQDMGIPE